VASASATVQPRVQDVKASVAALQEAASGLTKDNVKAKAPAIAAANRQVVAATQALDSSLTNTCVGG